MDVQPHLRCRLCECCVVLVQPISDELFDVGAQHSAVAIHADILASIEEHTCAHVDTYVNAVLTRMYEHEHTFRQGCVLVLVVDFLDLCGCERCSCYACTLDTHLFNKCPVMHTRT